MCKKVERKTSLCISGRFRPFFAWYPSVVPLEGGAQKVAKALTRPRRDMLRAILIFVVFSPPGGRGVGRWEVG